MSSPTGSIAPVLSFDAMDYCRSAGLVREEIENRKRGRISFGYQRRSPPKMTAAERILPTPAVSPAVSIEEEQHKRQQGRLGEGVGPLRRATCFLKHRAYDLA